MVLKADGLAAGKGVIVAAGMAEAEDAARAILEERRFGAAGARLLAEDFLTGTECSMHAFVDGRRAVALPLAQDHKRLLAGDIGPNTGGMGTVSPPAVAQRDPALAGRLEREILAPFIAGLAADELDFRGLIFPGVMLTPAGPRVLEFNARFGDPETQVLLPRLRSDLLPLLEACADGSLGRVPPIEWDQRAAVCVILASEGYPGKAAVGRPITGLENLAIGDDLLVFPRRHAPRRGRPASHLRWPRAGDHRARGNGGSGARESLRGRRPHPLRGQAIAPRHRRGTRITRRRRYRTASLVSFFFLRGISIVRNDSPFRLGILHVVVRPVFKEHGERKREDESQRDPESFADQAHGGVEGESEASDHGVSEARARIQAESSPGDAHWFQLPMSSSVFSWPSLPFE